MDFDAKLNSTSVRDQSAAALFLRAQGAEGVKNLPALLQKCQAVDPSKELDGHEEALLGFGAMTMASVVAEVGFDAEEPLHNAILCCILQLTMSQDIRVAGHSVYALEKLGLQCPAAKERLCDVAVSDRRSDEHEHVSLRAVALRLLRRLDTNVAATFADAPAFDEYAHAVEHWISTGTSTAPETQSELLAEREWLAKIKGRQTKP